MQWQIQKLPLDPWKCPMPGWMGLWAGWDSGRCSCLWQGVGTGWSERSLPTQTSPWFHDLLLFYMDTVLAQGVRGTWWSPSSQTELSLSLRSKPDWLWHCCGVPGTWLCAVFFWGVQTNAGKVEFCCEISTRIIKWAEMLDFVRHLSPLALMQ